MSNNAKDVTIGVLVLAGFLGFLYLLARPDAAGCSNSCAKTFRQMARWTPTECVCGDKVVP